MKGRSRATRTVFICLSAASLISTLTVPAYADSYLDYLICKGRERLATLAGLTTTNAERAVIATCYALYKNQNRNVSFLGQPALADAFPVSDVPFGQDRFLTFEFIDPVTGEPTSGPAIGSVLYEINIDATMPDVFRPLGSSSDASSHFGFSVTLTDLEPDFQAIPFDPMGNPIVMTGVGDLNVAIGSVVNIPISEPPGLHILGSILIAAIACVFGCRARGVWQVHILLSSNEPARTATELTMAERLHPVPCDRAALQGGS